MYSNQTQLVSNIYSLIAENIKKYLRTTESTDCTRDFFKLQKMPSDNSIDYSNFSKDFAKLYWLKNYWKAVYFFEYEYILKRLDNFKVLSLGSGSAADTVACMVWLNEHMGLNSEICIELLDKSEEQLSLAKLLIEIVYPKLEKVKWKIDYRKIDLSEWEPEENSYDLILMSHILTENNSQIQSVSKKIKSAVKGLGDILIIEREQDPTWQKAIEILNKLGISVYDSNVSNPNFLEIKNRYVVENQKNSDPHYIKASVPNLKFQADIVMNYFNAWNHQSTNLIREIFSSHAIYDEKPGIEPTIFGINDIVEYWKINPMSQSNIKLQVKNVAYCDNLAVCSFKGDFNTTKQHIIIQGSMNFFIDPHSKKINKFTEYFGTTKTPFLKNTC